MSGTVSQTAPETTNVQVRTSAGRGRPPAHLVASDLVTGISAAARGPVAHPGRGTLVAGRDPPGLARRLRRSGRPRRGARPTAAAPTVTVTAEVPVTGSVPTGAVATAGSTTTSWSTPPPTAGSSPCASAAVAVRVLSRDGRAAAPAASPDGDPGGVRDRARRRVRRRGRRARRRRVAPAHVARRLRVGPDVVGRRPHAAPGTSGICPNMPWDGSRIMAVAVDDPRRGRDARRRW